MFMLTHTMGSLIIPLLTLTYILQIPAILFSGFSSFKFKDARRATNTRLWASFWSLNASLGPLQKGDLRVS